MDHEETITKDLQPKKKRFNFIPYTVMFCVEYTEILYSNIYKNAKTPTEPEELEDDTTAIIKMAGAIFVGILMQVYGTKRSIQLTLMMTGTGAIFMYFVNPHRLVMFSMGFLTLQFAAGMEVSAIVYVAETCLPEQRNFLLSLLIPATYLGKCVPCFLQNLFPNQNQYFHIFFIIIITLVSFYSLKYFPESYSDINNEFSGTSIELKEEKKENNCVDVELGSNSNSKTIQRNDEKKSTFMEEFMTWRTLNISAGIFPIFWFYYLTVLILNALMENILQKDFAPEIGPTNIHGVNILHLVTLAAAVMGALMIRKFCVETVIFISGVMYCLACAAGSVYEFEFFGVEGQYKPTRFCLIPVICIWLAQGFLTTGIGIPTIIMIAENYPPQIRGFASGLMWAIIVLPCHKARKIVEQTNEIPFWVMFFVCGFCGLEMLCLPCRTLLGKLRKLCKNETQQQNVT